MSPDIPAKYKALIYDNPGQVSTKIVELDTPEPDYGQVLIRMTHSGVCHSDFGVMTNSWAILPHPTQADQVGGHEGKFRHHPIHRNSPHTFTLTETLPTYCLSGVGEVVKLGPGAEKSNLKVGQRVGVKWIAEICSACPACLAGKEGLCFNQKISGYYTPGTFQQYVLGPADYVTPIPDGLDSAAAAPM